MRSRSSLLAFVPSLVGELAMNNRTHIRCAFAVSAAIFAASSATSQMRAPPPIRAPDDAILATDRMEDQNRLETLLRQRGGSLGIDLRGFDVSKTEAKLLRDTDIAMRSQDLGKAKIALSAAQSKIQSNDAKFVLAALKLQLATKVGDQVLQSQATDDVLASGRVPAAIQPTLYRNQASFALEANDFAKAEGAFEKLLSLHPDAETAVSLAQIKSNQGKFQEALPLYERAITMQSQSGRPVPEVWNRATQYARQKAQGG